MAPKPTGGPLRPAVRCPTIKYNAKVRLGRGFSKEELKEAGIPIKFARTIGIAVDLRRVNKSVESLQVRRMMLPCPPVSLAPVSRLLLVPLQANVARLNEYKQKLILFPRKQQAKKAGGHGQIADSSPGEISAAEQVKGTPLPLVAPEMEYPSMAITEEMKATGEGSVRSQLRLARNLKRMKGLREKAERDRKAEKEKK